MPTCTAHRSASGTPCRANAIVGGTVCVTHGGRAPQVRAKALERMAAQVDPVLTELFAMYTNEKVDHAVKVRIMHDILDRTGFRPIDQLKLSGDAEAPLEIIITRTAGDVPRAESAPLVPLD